MQCFFIFIFFQISREIPLTDIIIVKLADPPSRSSSDREPSQRSQASRCPAGGRPQGSSHGGGHGGLQDSHRGASEAGGAHARQHGHGGGEGEQDGHGRVDGHDLAELGERHDDAEEERHRGDDGGDGAGQDGHAHLVHRLQASPLPLGPGPLEGRSGNTTRMLRVVWLIRTCVK